jgi:Suppressor of fused protein (SUFU)
MFSWLGKNTKTSPGGSVICRHDHSDPSGIPKEGLPREVAAQFRDAREEAYELLFGPPVSVSHEVFPLVPHIDVYTFKRRGRDGRETCTLATGGMSDLPMTLPSAAAKDAPRRIELIFYCSEPNPEYVATLRWLAHFPHDYKTWVGSSHTIPNGDPPEPFWGTADMDTILFIPPIIVRDQSLPKDLRLDGEPVHFLWVVPLTKAEGELKLAKGAGAIFNLFEQHQHHHVFDPNRASYA